MTISKTDFSYTLSGGSSNPSLTSVNSNANYNVVLTNGSTGTSQLSTDYNTDLNYNYTLQNINNNQFDSLIDNIFIE